MVKTKIELYQTVTNPYEAIFRLLFNKIVEKTELTNNLKVLAEGFLGNINNESWKPFSTEPDVEIMCSSSMIMIS